MRRDLVTALSILFVLAAGVTAVNVALGLPGVEFKGQLAIFAPPPGAGRNESSPEAAACQAACVLYWRERGVAELGRAPEAGPRLPPGFRGGRDAAAEA